MAPFALLLALALSAPIILTLGHAIKLSGCDINNVKISTLPPPLTPPTFKLAYVAIGVGTQNYTCGDTGTFTNVGALAELFDISCFAHNPLIFKSIPDIAIDAWKAAPSVITASEVISTLHALKSPEILGQHYYVPVSNGGVDPKWDFTSQGSTAGNPDAFVIAAKVNQTVVPTGSQNIPWVSLKNLSGELAQQVYRTDTRLGQPPATCTPGSPEIVVKYTAIYWLYGKRLSNK